MWYAHEGELRHAFFDRSPESLGDADLRRWSLSVSNATSRGLRRRDRLGTGFAPSDGAARDD